MPDQSLPDPDRPRPRTYPDSVAAAVHEAFALALDDRPREALRLLDDVLEQPGLAAGAARDEVRLARARVASRVSSDAWAATFDDLAGSAGSTGWRAALEQARIERRAGRMDKAAEWLRRSLDEFRTTPILDPGTEGGVTDSGHHLFQELLTREAEQLTGVRRQPSPGEVAGANPEIASEISLRSLLDLIKLGQHMARQKEPEEVLRLMLHEALRLTGTTRGFVVRDRDGELQFAVAENIDQSVIDNPALEVSRTLVRQVRETGQSQILVLPDLPEGHPATRSLEAIGITEVFCVPLLGEHGTLGVLYLDTRSTGHTGEVQPRTRSRTEVVRLLDLFASQAAAALDNADAHHSLCRALETAEESLRRHRTESLQRTGYDVLVGASAPMQEIYRQLDLIVPTEETVLITGETGTGKDLVARLVHTRGPRSNKEFVAVNCASLSESLLESELFGYERGAFTGADRARPGLFEVADGGTLFLDEIGDMSPRMQAELLRVLQTGEVRRVGGRQILTVSVRVIAATHRDLEEWIRLGEFRQDLFYRLNVLPIHLPALRERGDDIPLLVERLMPRLVGERTSPTLAPEVYARLACHSWPGNVRELENLLRRLIATGRSTIRVRDLPVEVRRSAEESGTGTLRDAEARAIRQALRQTAGNKAKAARVLGINRATLYAKLKLISG